MNARVEMLVCARRLLFLAAGRLLVERNGRVHRL